jgi:hypothetical protein
MNELNEVWEQLLAEAAKTPNIIQNQRLKDFLAVKTANDLIRQTAIKTLFDAMLEIAVRANRKNANIIIEHENSHRFSLEKFSLSGEALKFRRGVRCLMIEAGWTRTPQDGFMRGNALAVTRISHFGISKANAELHLLNFENEPRWFTINKNGMKISLELEDLIKHFQIFLE